MRIIDKLEVYRLVDQTCLASSTYFLVAPRVLLELDHDSWIILPLFSVWSSLSCALKIHKGLMQGSPSANMVSCTVQSLIMAFTCRPSPYWLFSFFCISSSPFSSVALTVAVLLKYLWNCWIEVRSVSDLQAIDGKDDLLCIWLKQEGVWRCKGSRRLHRDSLRLWNWRQERT